MNVAFGFKAHSAWAALVALSVRDGELQVIDRRRVDLVADPSSMWSKQPYHAAERLAPDEACRLVTREIDSARRIAVREMRAALMRVQDAQQQIVGCAVLVGEPMPSWTVDQILAVHFRMHEAEGMLFRNPRRVCPPRTRRISGVSNRTNRGSEEDRRRPLGRG